MRLRKLRFAVWLLLVMPACKPDLGSSPSLVDRPRVLGVRVDPPQARPGAPVKVEVLAVGPGGRTVAPAEAFQWSLCLEPKPPAENNVVNGACADGSSVMPVAETGPAVTVTLPMTACALHGPDRPPTKAGEPPLRPRDPDVTGGYYQPIGLQLKAGGVAVAESFALARLTCSLPSVSLEVAQEFQSRYRANVNPSILGLYANGMPLTAATETAPAVAVNVRPGQTVSFEAGWTPESREVYPVYDVARRQIVDHAEELSFSWFATAGDFDRDRTGRTEAETANTIFNTWVAPSTAGPVHVWLVLRDSRGGLAFAEYLVMVGG